MSNSISNPFDLIQLFGTNVFQNCLNLSTINFMSKKINNVVITSELSTGVFFNCVSLEKVFLENNATNLDEELFFNCEKLNEVKLPNTLTNMGISVFESCVSLEKINLPDTITFIDNFSFYNCSSLKTIHIPKELTSIEASVFEQCTSLMKIQLNNRNITELKQDCFKGCENLEEVWLDDNVFQISDLAFVECPKLEQPNTALFVTTLLENVNTVYSYIKYLYPQVKLILETSYDEFQNVFTNSKNLLDKTIQETKNVLYPLLDIQLLDNNTTVSNTFFENIVGYSNTIKNAIRKIMFDFIFYNNSPYIAFKTYGNKLSIASLNNTNIIKVYKSDQLLIDADTDLSTVYATFHTFGDTFSTFYLDNYLVKIFYDNINNRYKVQYSTNYFITSTELSSTGSNLTIDKSVVSFGENYYFITITSGGLGSTARMDFYLTALNIDTTSLKATLEKGTLPSDLTVVDALADFDIPLSWAKQTFQYYVNAIDVDDEILNDVKFRMVEPITSTTIPTHYYGNISPGLSRVYENKISYYLATSENTNVKNDFVRHIAKEIFGTANAVDLFNNETDVLISIEENLKNAFSTRLEQLFALSSEAELATGGVKDLFDSELSDDYRYFPSKLIFKQLYYDQPARFVNMGSDEIIPGENWRSIPFIAGDKLYMIATINANETQKTIINLTGGINQRKYRIKLNIVDDSMEPGITKFSSWVHK